MWVFEIWMSEMQTWMPMMTSEDVNAVIDQFDWYCENRPDLLLQLNLRDIDECPESPEPPVLVAP